MLDLIKSAHGLVRVVLRESRKIANFSRLLGSPPNLAVLAPLYFLGEIGFRTMIR